MTTATSTGTATSSTGTTTTTNGTATTTKGEATPEWAKELNTNIGQLVKGVDALRQHSEEGLRRQQQAPTQDTDDEPEDDPLNDPQLDLQPMSVVARRILDQVEGVVDRALKPVVEKIGQTEITAKTTQITAEVNDFMQRTPDFSVWAPEMAEVAKQYPNMAVADIYGLAKMRNPAKVESIAKEAKAKQTKDEAEAAKAKRKASPFSLSPAGDTGEVVNESMSAGDAAKSAWDATVEKFGGSPFQSG